MNRASRVGSEMCRIGCNFGRSDLPVLQPVPDVVGDRIGERSPEAITCPPTAGSGPGADGAGALERQESLAAQVGFKHSIAAAENLRQGQRRLSCGHFATDATHLDELIDQRSKTLTLIDVRRNQYRQRTGRELTDENVWIHERRREVASLDAIIERLRTDTAVSEEGNSVGARARPTACR